MNNFRVGQKVVCVRNVLTLNSEVHLPAGPRVFTVIGTGQGRNYKGVLSPGIELKEVQPVEQCTMFDAAFFRPVVEPSTDTGMAILRKLLELTEELVQ